MASKKPSRLSAKAKRGKLIQHHFYFDLSNQLWRVWHRIVIIAADISPIDVLSHLPILCEDKSIPYIYVKSRAEIGEACKTKRPTSCVLITTPQKGAEKLKKAYERCLELVNAKNPYVN